MRSSFRTILLTAVAMTSAAGCAVRRVPAQAPQAPPRQVVAEAQVPAVPTAAQLALAQILPPATLPAPATRPAAPNHRPPLESLTLYAEACDNLLKHRRLAAIGLLEKAVALDPDSFELHYALGRAYLGGGGADPRSIAEMERAAEIDPDHVELQTDLGRQYLARGDADKALWHLRLALVTSDYATDEAEAAVAELFAGRALARGGYHTAALEVYERLGRRLQSPTFALRGDPEIAYLLTRPELLRLQAADSYEQVGRYEEALRAFDAAAEREPDDFGLRARSVRLLLALGRHDDAVARAADAVARSDADPAALRLLREACRAAGREGGVATELRRLRRQRPRDVGLLFALADVLRGEGKAREAIELLRPAADANPPRGGAVRRIYECRLDLDPTGRDAARFLIGWSAAHPDAVHLLPDRWEDLVRPTLTPRFDLRSLRALEPAAASGADAARWEAAKWFWVAHVAGLRHRRDLARDALRRATSGPAVFAPAMRAAAGAVVDADSETDSGDVNPADEELPTRAARAGEVALAEELRGLSDLNRKRYAEARRHFAEAARLGGTSPDLQFARAVAARHAGDHSEFEGLLWKLASDWPLYEDAYEALYGHYSEQGADASAARVLSAWLGADRSSLNGHLLQARDLLRAGRTAAGERMLEVLLAERGDSARVLALARSYYTQAGRLDAFVSKLSERHAARPADVATAAQLADILAVQKRTAEASRVLDTARAAVAGDPDLLYGVAHLYERVGQKSMTEQVLREVLRLDAAHAPAANDLGYTLADEGRELARAEVLTRQAVEADPANASFLDSLGWVLYKRGRFDEAGRALGRAVDVARARGQDPDPVVLDHLGDVLYRAGDAAGAAGRWKQAIERLGATPNAAARDDLKSLRLQLERKTKQAESGQPVTVAPVAADEPAADSVGAATNSTPARQPNN